MARASLDGITPTITYYSGNNVSPRYELSGAPINAGTYTVVAAFAGDTTYVSASAFTTFTIAKAPLTVKANGSATYGDAAATEGFIATGFVFGQNVSVLGGTAAYTTSYAQGAAAGTSETVDVTGLTASNYAISYVEGTFLVGQKALTVTATGSATYGDAAATEGFSGSGFVLGQDASVLAGPAMYTTSYTPGDAAGTNETVSVSGLTSNNYAISYFGGTFTVAQKALTVTATGSATYGDAAATEGFIATGFVFGQDVSVLGGTAAYTTSYAQGAAAGTSETVDVTGLTASNYAISYVGAMFTVAQKALTVTATGSATYGDAATTEGFSGSGFVLGQNASFLGGTAAYITSYTPGDAAGTNETVSVSGLTSSNYAISYVGGTFTVAKANATVVVTAYTVPYDGLPHTATYTIAGVNGETGATVGTVDVSKTTHTKAGIYASDTWNFPATANYNSIANTTITDIINPGALSKFVFSTIASPRTAGTPFTVTITAEDANGNTVTGFTGTVKITSNARLSGSPVTSVKFVKGVDANQSLTITSAQSGTTLTTNDGSGHTGTSNAFTVNAGAAASIAVSAGNNQGATDNTAFAANLAAIVEDRYGNVVPGATVTFVAPASTFSGTFAGNASVSTNASGRATAPAFTANLLAGSYTVTASVNGVATSAKFSLINKSPLGSSANDVYVENVYALLLGRVADMTGGQAWVNALNTGISPVTMVQDIEQSPEYLDDMVTALYRHYLNRAPDSGGLSAFAGQLAGGMTIEAVAAEIVSSPEYFNDAGNNSTTFVQHLLSADTRPERFDQRGEWVGHRAKAGASHNQVALDFLTSMEYRTDLIAGGPWTPYSPLTNWGGYYPEFLLRPAGTGEVASWLHEFSAGLTDQQILASIFASAEGLSKW